jgi:hypothetical protein
MQLLPQEHSAWHRKDVREEGRQDFVFLLRKVREEHDKAAAQPEDHEVDRGVRESEEGRQRGAGKGIGLHLRPQQKEKQQKGNTKNTIAKRKL